MPRAILMWALAVDLDTLACVCRQQAVCLLVAFGSAVRELRGPASDLDLAVWMTTAKNAPLTLVRLEVALRPLFLGECLDLVLLNRASPLLQFQVALHGAVLFEAAPVLSVAFALSMAQSTGLRNRLVHQYEAIDHAIVHSAITEAITQYTEYCRHITTFVDRHVLPPTA